MAAKSSAQHPPFGMVLAKKRNTLKTPPAKVSNASTKFKKSREGVARSMKSY